MFVPGDPIEQRKRALIAKMAGGRGKGGAGGGFKVGRPAGAGFGRGIGFGGGGGVSGQRGLALPQLLGGYGGGGPGGNEGFGQGLEQPQFGMGPSAFGQQSAASDPFIEQLRGPQAMQPMIPPQLLQQLLGGYGQAATPQYSGRLFAS